MQRVIHRCEFAMEFLRVDNELTTSQSKTARSLSRFLLYQYSSFSTVIFSPPGVWKTSSLILRTHMAKTSPSARKISTPATEATCQQLQSSWKARRYKDEYMETRLRHKAVSCWTCFSCLSKSFHSHSRVWRAIGKPWDSLAGASRFLLGPIFNTVRLGVRGCTGL